MIIHSPHILGGTHRPAGSPTRIGFDGGCLTNRRGFGRFARQVLAALARSRAGRDLVALIDRPSIDLVEVPVGVEVVPVPVREAPSRAASSQGRRGLLDLFAMGLTASRAGLDLLYYPASYSYFPAWNVGKVVVTVHDTMAYKHPDLIFPNRRGRLAWRIKERAAVRRADRLVTVSESARRDVMEWHRLPESAVGVIPEGPSEAFYPRPAGPGSDAVLDRRGIDPSRRFLLYVGGLSPHKNLLRLIEAYARSGAPADADLVLVGDLGDVFHTHVPELRGAVARLGLAGRVRFTGFVPDEDLAHLDSRAYALVQPSLAEGFGLPPLEAMACGTPVLASRAGSLPEVIGDAGRFFEPTDVDAIADAIRRILDDPAGRDRLAARALNRSRLYTWDAAASALWAEFDALTNTRTPIPPQYRAHPKPAEVDRSPTA